MMAMNYEPEIKQYYSDWWESPRDTREIIQDSLNRLVQRRIPPGNGRRALDLGSGKGRIVSYLLEKGYQVSAVEFSEEFVHELRRRFPSVEVVLGDVRRVDFGGGYDVVTMIELAQNLEKDELAELFARLSHAGRLLVTNISNRMSFHSLWENFRGFRKPFVHHYTPNELHSMLRPAGFSIEYSRGLGLVTPATMFEGFRGKVVPVCLAQMVNVLDPLFPRLCHLYYVEARAKAAAERRGDRS